MLRHPRRLATSLETWETPDGDVIDVERLPRRPGAPHVVVLHGLEGSSQASYVVGMLREIDARGWNGLALNFRSCGPSAPRHARTYHSGFTDDLAFVVDRLAREEEASAIGVVGYSLGGNVTVKLLGERGEAAPIAAAVAVSVPFDLAACAAALDGEGFWPWLYRTAFLRTLREKAVGTAKRFPGTLDFRTIRSARTFRAFDEGVTAKLFGFAGADDYWARASSGPDLPGIRRPTLLLSAADDPLIPLASIPREAIAANPATTLALLAHGGHVGFVGGGPVGPVYAAERIAASFLARHVEPANGGRRA